MTVVLTSPVLGQAAGSNYTGNLESWLLAEGYAKQAGYTGPGVANTGLASADDTNDPRLAANREAPYFPGTKDRHVTVANDATNLGLAKLAAPDFDFDAGSVDTEVPSDLNVEPRNLALAGGKVTVEGNNLEGVTGATVGGTAVTNLDTSKAGDGVITFTAPAKTAGAQALVLNEGATPTAVGNLTYA